MLHMHPSRGPVLGQASLAEKGLTGTGGARHLQPLFYPAGEAVWEPMFQDPLRSELLLLGSPTAPQAQPTTAEPLPCSTSLPPHAKAVWPHFQRLSQG